MDQDTYERLSGPHLKGRLFRLNRPLTTNHGLGYPAGTVLRFEGKRRGYALVGPRCPHCGVLPHLKKVPPGAVDLLEPEEEQSIEECNPGVGPWLP